MEIPHAFFFFLSVRSIHLLSGPKEIDNMYSHNYTLKLQTPESFLSSREAQLVCFVFSSGTGRAEFPTEIESKKRRQVTEEHAQVSFNADQMESSVVVISLMVCALLVLTTEYCVLSPHFCSFFKKAPVK